MNDENNSYLLYVNTFRAHANMYKQISQFGQRWSLRGCHPFRLYYLHFCFSDNFPCVVLIVAKYDDLSF